jgi:hypothetical protein
MRPFQRPPRAPLEAKELALHAVQAYHLTYHLMTALFECAR